MVNSKYSKIVMLVHPLYSPFLGSVLGMSRKVDDLKLLFRSLLGAYGKKILELEKDSDAFFIIVKYDFSNMASPYREQFEELERIFLEPFFDFVKRRLGNKIYITNFVAQDRDTMDLLPSNFKEIFERKLSVFSFGEHYDGCVKFWSWDLQNILDRNGFSYTLERLPKYSLPSVAYEGKTHTLANGILKKQNRRKNLYLK